MNTQSTDKPSSVQVDNFHYNVDGIKKGGMGTVYLLSGNQFHPVNDPVYKNSVAVKVFDADFKKEFVTNELNIWIQLNNRNILPLLKIVNINYKIGALMPMCFHSIQDLLDKNGIMSIPQALNVISQLTNALNFAYSTYGVLHLDLKPSNILCRSRSDSLDSCVLSDWGIATIQRMALTKTKSTPDAFLKDYSRVFSNYGTLPYMAPERFFESCQATIQCDIYSLGLILFQLVSGALPFLPTENEITFQIVSGEYFSTVIQYFAKNQLPDKFCKIILNCISPKVSDRYNEYKALNKDIEKLSKHVA
jgi:serine/threonine protein kinase